MTLLVLTTGLIAGFSRESTAADPAKVQQSIARAATFLKSHKSWGHGGERSIAAIALLKAGVPPDAPEIQEAVKHVLDRVDSTGVYKINIDSHTYYNAGVDAILLADAGGEQYVEQLKAIATFLQGGQRPNGSWDYPVGGADGDTSCTHYALLGLWACARSGVTIPPSVWVESLKWHLRTQNPDGGFSYKPGTTVGHGNGMSVMNMTVNGVGSMAIAWVNLSDSPPSLEEDAPKPAAKVAVKAPPKNNTVLEAVPVVAPTNEPLMEKGSIPPGTAKAMKRGYNWIVPRFVTENRVFNYDGYYYYSLERMTALINVTNIGTRDWFNECADVMLARQKPTGDWEMGATDTTLMVLSLARSTAKLLKRMPPTPTFGNGLLAGGRGLPTNLKDGDPPKTTKAATPLDQLLSSLSKASNLEVEEMQEQLVEQVQIGDRESLVKQKDLLVKLIQHPNVEVRRTAAWALGRTNDLKLARYLITALEDPDLDVAIEAHNGLSWISRKPSAFGLPLSPLEDLPPDAGPDVQAAAVSAWRTSALKNWGKWYLTYRPFSERGDEFEARLREKLATLN